MKTTQEMIEVMQAYADGEKIEYRNSGLWRVTVQPLWNWHRRDYRIAVTQDSIDWAHVHEDYKWMARDKNGLAVLYIEKPDTRASTYFYSYSPSMSAHAFSSYKRGTCDWKDSLVERPS